MKRNLFSVLVSLCFSVSAFSQDFSNKGKDFWVGYGYHQIMVAATNTNAQQMVLYFATDQTTTITISIPAVGYTQTLTSGPLPGVLTSAPIPKTGAQDVRLLSESTAPENKGIHITSDKPIVAYAHIYNQSVSGATILFPSNTLVKEYYSINYTNVSNSSNANCFFYVVASDTGTTTVEITPSAATINHAAGVPFTVNLTQGQIYNIMGQYTNGTNTGVDLTGSRIRSLASASGGCKRIGVFSGSGRIGISCPGGASSSDNYMVQSFPQTAWGKKYLTNSTGGASTFNIYRICVSNPLAVVKVNGLPIGVALQNNFYYELPLTNLPQKIESDLPITVAQYTTSQNRCGNGQPGDPEMIYLSSVEQNINKVLWNATNNFNISQSYYNVIIPNTGSALSSFTLDGANVPAALFTIHPQDPGYSYLTQSVTSGQSHIIQSDSGFNAIAYGFGDFESYGYNAGTNVKDLYQQISTATQYGIGTSAAVCTGTPFKFKISLPYQPDSLQLNFLGATNLPGPPFTNTTLITPINSYDSITTINGKTIYWYSFPIQYNFNNVGVYPIRITAYSPPVAGGCGSIQDIDFDLDVSAPPTIDFANTTPRCVAETVQFTDMTNSAKPTYRWYWNFGDPGSGAQNISFLKNPTHVFSTSGPFTVRFNSITTAGCGAGDTIQKAIVIAALPSATVTGSVSVCLNAAAPVITFTGAGGSAPYTFTYNINGGAAQTLTTVGASNTATVNAPTNVAGTFIYNLTGVQNTGSSLCNTSPIPNQSATVIVKALPTALVSGTTTVCQNTASPNITFTGNGGTAPYTFSYNINGGATQTVTTIAGNSVTVAVPTTTAGTFTYNLTGVSESSSNACANIIAGTSAVVTILPAPTASISGTTAVCKNAASPLITFTGNGGTAPYTFTYSINGGGPQTITTVAGNAVTLAVSTAVTGTFTYTLISVQDGSTSGCIALANGSAVVTVNPLPTAVISGNSTVCLNAVSPVITFTGSNGTSPYIFNYTLNGVAQTAIVSAGNIATINAPTGTAGIFTYTLTSVTDGSSTVCTGSASGSAVITVKALPTATITGSTSVCQNAAQPVITFTGSTGTAPYTFTYQINGGAPITISTVGASTTVTVNAPTAASGTFVYTLLTVTESSANLCANTLSPQPTATVIINPLPTATVTGGTNVCLNAVSPVVTFTGAGGTAPYTFTYTINGAAQTPLVSTGNTATLNVPTGIAGPFTYQLVSVKDGSSTTCSQNQNGSTLFTIYPAPVVAFTFTTPSCDTRTITFNSSGSSAGAGSITSYAWTFGDPGSGAANTSALQNPIHLFTGTGTYNVILTITTSNGCSNTLNTTNVTITPRPQTGFVLPEVCLLDPFAQFTDTTKIASPGTITAWKWNFGDPGSGALDNSTLQNPQHTYSLVGNYNVRLIAFSNTGCSDTLVQVLTVNGGNPQSNFTIQNAANCANDSVGIINKSTIASGNITKLEIYWDNTGQPAAFDVDQDPLFNKVYRHKYPDFQSPLTKTYNVRARAFSGGVCFSDKIIAVTVNASPKVQFNVIPNACYIQPPFQLTQASEIGGVPGTAIYSGPGVSSSGLFTPAGQPIGVPLTIKYKFTSSAAGCVDSASQTITLIDTASAKFSVSAPVCESSAASFTDLSTAPAGIILQNTVWDFGDGTPAENHVPGSTFTHSFPGTGTFIVKMYNSSTNGCRSATRTLPVIVSPIPRPKFTFDKTDYCVPNAVVAFNSSGSTIADGTQNTFTYVWNFGDPGSGNSNTSTAANPSHTYAAAGNYTINLQIRSGAGCVHDTSIVLNRLHPQPVASFDFGKAAICIDQDAIFINRSTGADGTLTNWAWDFGDNSGTSALQNPLPYHYNGPGVYKVKLLVTNSFGCMKDTTKTINVYPYPIVDAGITRFVLEGGSVTLQPTVTAVQPQYLWTWNVSDPTGYLNDPRIKNPVSSPLSDVLYTLTVTGAGDCASSDTVFVKLLKAPRIPNTFSPNNDGINDFWVIKYLESYPKAKVQVFNRTGQLVFESRGYPKPWDGNVNGKSLPVDTYYYVIEPENGRAPITGYVTIVK